MCPCKFKNLKAHFSVATLMALAAQPLSAGEAEAEKESAVEGEVLVTGQRLQQSIENVPNSVTVIGAGEIARIQAKDLGDVFNYDPSVDVVSDSRYGIRSVAIRGLEGNYVKIKVDNLDMPAEFDNSELISSSRLDLDTDMIKQVEVIRGPASSAQGSDAMGGTVLITTKDPADFLDSAGDGSGGHFKTDYHSESNASSQNLVLANRRGKLESMLSFTRRSGEELEKFGDSDDEEYDRDSALAKLQYQLNDAHRLELIGEYVGSETDIVPVDSGVYDIYLYSEDESTRQRLGFKHQWNAETVLFDSLAWQLDWQEKEQRSHTYRQCSGFAVGCFTGSSPQDKDYLYKEDGYALDIQFNKGMELAGAAHNIAYGLTYRDIGYENTNVTYYDDDEDGSYERSRWYFYIPEAQSDTTGIYLQDEIVLLDESLRITPGVRYDSFEVDPNFNRIEADGDLGISATNTFEPYSESAFTWRLGALYDLTESIKVYAQFSEGFKSPDFKQLFYSFSNDGQGYKSEPNGDLKAEFSESFELGSRFDLGAVGRVEVNAFVSDFTDFIGRVTDYSNPDYPLGITRSENIAEATIKGVEVHSTLNLDEALGAPSGLSAGLAFSYNEGEDGEGNPLEEVNPWSTVASLNYDSDTWGSSLRMNYVSAKDASDVVDADSQYLPDSYLVADLTAYFQPTENLTLRGGVYNLADEQYQRWSRVRGLDTDMDVDYYSETGRNFAITAKYAF